MNGFTSCLVMLAACMATSLFAPATSLAASPEAATVTLATGRANVVTVSGQIQALGKTSLVNAGDTVVTGPSSYINLRFTDGGRILIRPNSRFQVAEYRYQPEEPAENRSSERNVQSDGGDNAVFRLLKGGFRAITGLIGKENRENFRVRTPVATIGIRGTDFEARLCDGDCFDVDPMPRDGLYAGVLEGGITLANGKDSIERNVGEYAFISDARVAAVALPQRPRVLSEDPMPDPEACD